MPRKSKALVDPRQIAFTKNYLMQDSDTYANAYRSALAAGFKPEYAKTITARQPQWLSDIVNKLIPSETEIIAGIKQETSYGKNITQKDTALAAQVRLKAWELLGKTKRSAIFDNGKPDYTQIGTINITLGGGGSAKPLPGHTPSTVVETVEGEVIDPTPTPPLS